MNTSNQTRPDIGDDWHNVRRSEAGSNSEAPGSDDDISIIDPEEVEAATLVLRLGEGADMSKAEDALVRDQIAIPESGIVKEVSNSESQVGDIETTPDERNHDSGSDDSESEAIPIGGNASDCSICSIKSTPPAFKLPYNSGDYFEWLKGNLIPEKLDKITMHPNIETLFKEDMPTEEDVDKARDTMEIVLGHQGHEWTARDWRTLAAQQYDFTRHSAKLDYTSDEEAEYTSDAVLDLTNFCRVNAWIVASHHLDCRSGTEAAAKATDDIEFAAGEDYYPIRTRFRKGMNAVKTQLELKHIRNARTARSTGAAA